MEEETKLQKRNEWFYSTGCIGRDMTYTFISLFIITFIQFTSGLDNKQFATVVIIMILCRVWDAVNDPMMGTIITNTKAGKHGRYRPYVLYGALINAVTLVGLFFLTVFSGWTFVIAFGVLYLLWGMSFTANDVSYWSILPALAKKKKARDRLTSKVAVFASLGAFIAGGLTPILTTGNAVTAYRILAIIFAVIFVLCQVMVYFKVHEENAPCPKEKMTIRDMFKVIYNNKQLMWMVAVVFSYSLGSVVLTSFGQNYFYLEFGYQGLYMMIFTIIFGLGTILSQALYSTIAKKFKRKDLNKVSLIAAIIGYSLFFIVGMTSLSEVSKLVILCSVGLLIFFGQGIFYMNMLVELTNTIEYDELRIGVRNEAVIFSVRPFMVKLSGAFQQLILLIVLLGSGIKNITDKVALLEKEKGLHPEINITERANTIFNSVSYNQKTVYLLSMCLVPIILFIFCYYILDKKYIIDEVMYENILEKLEKRKKEELSI